MALYAIADLHLASSGEKPMDIFGEKWSNHHEKIKDNWLGKITEEDTVLIAGDISWSMKMEHGIEDLEYINKLPGKKFFVRGNHDYWWTSINKLNSMFEGMKFIQNNFFTYGDYAVCGSRGWILKNNPKFNEHDQKIYDLYYPGAFEIHLHLINDKHMYLCTCSSHLHTVYTQSCVLITALKLFKLIVECLVLGKELG